MFHPQPPVIKSCEKRPEDILCSQCILYLWLLYGELLRNWNMIYMGQSDRTGTTPFYHTTYRRGKLLVCDGLVVFNVRWDMDKRWTQANCQFLHPRVALTFWSAKEQFPWSSPSISISYDICKSKLQRASAALIWDKADIGVLRQLCSDADLILHSS